MVYSEKLLIRYTELKKEALGCLLLMQVGSFMQVIGEDARIVASLAGLKLQLVGKIDAPVVLGGFPCSGLDKYVGKLVRSGHSVAIAMQNEEKERQIVERIMIRQEERKEI